MLYIAYLQVFAASRLRPVDSARWKRSISGLHQASPVSRFRYLFSRLLTVYVCSVGCV